MALEIIGAASQPWGAIRQLLNRNTDELELRLQSLEVGNYIRSGGGAPSAGQFNNGDYYIDTNNWNLWRKLGGSWQLQTNLVGPEGINHRGVWDSGTNYVRRDGVVWRGSYWYALRANNNVTPNTVNTDDWQRIAVGYNFVGLWASGTTYERDDLVLHNGTLYRVSARHNSTTNPPNSPAQYDVFVQRGEQGIPGIENRGNYVAGTTYNARDAVVSRGAYWLALRTNTNVTPLLSNSDDWLKIARGLNPVGAWATAIAYRVDDIVTHNGSTYRIATQHTSSTAPPAAGDATYELLAGKGNTGDPGIINRIQVNGVNAAQQPNLNFGTGLIVTNDAANSRTTVVSNRKYNGFRVYLAAAQTIPSTPVSPWVKVNFDTESFNNTGAVITTNGRFTVPADLAGLWAFGAAVGIQVDGSGKRAFISLRRDTVPVATLDVKHAAAASPFAVVGDDLLICNANEVIDIAVWHNSATGEPLVLGSANTNFWGYFIGTV